jgi:hypothetical protein
VSQLVLQQLRYESDGPSTQAFERIRFMLQKTPIKCELVSAGSLVMVAGGF